jgi:creatinine amidohydrolase
MTPSRLWLFMDLNQFVVTQRAPHRQYLLDADRRRAGPEGVEACRVALFDLAYMSKEISPKLDFGPIGHGEDIEVSHMLYRHPDLVDLSSAKDNPHRHQPLYHLDPQDPRDTLCYVPATRQALQAVADETGDTVSGCPTKSTAEKGEAYHRHLVGRLKEVLAAMQ